MSENRNYTPPSPPKNRNSSIELLKIIAILSIIVSHCTQSLAFASPYYQGEDFLLDLGSSTTCPQQFFLSLLMFAGLFGNAIFIVSSFYFLQDSNHASKKKIFHFALDIWVISVIFLLVTLIIKEGELSKSLIIKQLFPNYFCTNWFMSLWMILYLIHPVLNRLMDTFGKRWHLRAIVLLFSFYCVLGLFFTGALFPSLILVWVCFYFIVGYMTRYFPNINRNTRFNVLLVVISLSIHILSLLFLNTIAQTTGLLEGHLLLFRKDCNPLFFFMAIGLFNLFSSKCFYSNTINKIAACSLFVYVIHENQLLRYLFRPSWWECIYNTYGYDNVVLWVGGMALLLFVTSLSLSFIYKKTFQRVTNKVGDSIFAHIAEVYGAIENRVI